MKLFKQLFIKLWQVGFLRSAPKVRAASLFMLIILGSVPAVSAPLYYTPTNPSFGGNPLYGSAFLNNANAQNNYKEPQDDEDESALDEFNERLQRSLLNRLTNTLASQLVDDDGNLVPGRTETTDFVIDVVDGGDGTTTITTTDRLSGDTTTFTVSNNE